MHHFIHCIFQLFKTVVICTLHHIEDYTYPSYVINCSKKEDVLSVCATGGVMFAHHTCGLFVMSQLMLISPPPPLWISL